VTPENSSPFLLHSTQDRNDISFIVDKISVSGINAAIFYTVEIFRIAGTSVTDSTASNLVKGTLIVATVVSVILSDRAGKKPLLIASGILGTLSFAAMGAYFYIKDKEQNEELAKDLGVLPVISLIVFVIAFSIGIGPLPWVMQNELFAQDLRSAAASAAVAFNWALAFLVTFTFGDLEHGLGEYGAFWFFAAFSALSIPFVFFLVPETKGKGIEDIQRLFAA
jgi:SP family facilitated glucose transporter-like MFS transporter 8